MATDHSDQWVCSTLTDRNRRSVPVFYSNTDFTETIGVVVQLQCCLCTITNSGTAHYGIEQFRNRPFILIVLLSYSSTLVRTTRSNFNGAIREYKVIT